MRALILYVNISRAWCHLEVQRVVLVRRALHQPRVNLGHLVLVLLQMHLLLDRVRNTCGAQYIYMWYSPYELKSARLHVLI